VVEVEVVEVVGMEVVVTDQEDRQQHHHFHPMP
jgi:hypothetical protein